MAEERAQETRTEKFAAYVRPAVRAAGYDIDSPRGGGRVALARDTGMSPSSVGRMLAGQTMPDPQYLERLAEVLGLQLTELLVRSGVVSRGAIPAKPPGPQTRPSTLTPAMAAKQLGIRSPQRIAMFEDMVRHFLQQEQSEFGPRKVG